MKAQWMIIAVLSIALQACGHDSSSSSSSGGGGDSSNPVIQAAQDKCASTPKNPVTDIRYVISETTNGNSCTTGCQIFTSFGSYCAGLLDDQLNNGCAHDSRQQAYEDNCR